MLLETREFRSDCAQDNEPSWDGRRFKMGHNRTGQPQTNPTKQPCPWEIAAVGKINDGGGGESTDTRWCCLAGSTLVGLFLRPWTVLLCRPRLGLAVMVVVRIFALVDVWVKQEMGPAQILPLRTMLLGIRTV